MGPTLTTIKDIQMLVPRGRFSMNFEHEFVKIHGKTHDYKLKYT